MRLTLVPARSHEPELLDDPAKRYEDVADAMRDIALVNRWLGGSAAIVRPVLHIVESARLREVSLLDVGTGSADVPAALARAMARRGIGIRFVGVDLDPQVVRYAADTFAGRDVERARHVVHGGSLAREDRISGETSPPSPRVSLVRADGFALPFEDRSFDLVTCSMFLHHFSELDAARLLGEFARVASRAVVVNDLARHLAPWLGIHLFARLIGAGRMFRNDAPLSVLRGWTADELFGVAARAGLEGSARIVRPVPYRLALLIEKEAA